MTNINNDWGGFSWEGKDPKLNFFMDVIMTDCDYEKATGMEFKEGRSFSSEFKTDSNAVILNEAAVKAIGYKNPVGKTMKLGDRVITIIGVTKDVVIRDPFKPVGPAAIVFRKSNTNTILMRVKENADLRATFEAIKPIFEKYNPSLPFEYKFADEEFGKKFKIVNQVAKLSGIFASLAILISCLGLFGLATFMAERRTKEIGIRKVLGASVSNLWILLSKEFILLVLIACLIASPIAYFLMNSWLELYEYRITIGMSIFAAVGLSAVLIALATISVQIVKVAVANPVKSLRSE